MVKTYDPKLVTVIFGGKIMSGFADGTMITIERNDPAFNLKVGTDGEGTRAKSNNKSGKITIHLMQSSASNDSLSAFAAADELSNTGVAAAAVIDKSGRTVVAAATAWVNKYPNAEFSKEPTTRSWVIETDELDIFLGGN